METSTELNPSPGAQRAWLLAGNATFTLVSNRTGARYTYKVQRDNLATVERYHVKLLIGPDNESSFVYLGAMRRMMRKVPAESFEQFWEFFRGKHSEYAEDSAPIVTFRWMWRRLQGNRPLEYQSNAADGSVVSGGAKFLHAGRCGRCGRKLTVPESIESGYGPECSSKS